MPWHVEQGGGTCNAGQWAVIKDDDGSTAGCHDSETDAHAQMAALYAQENQRMITPAEKREALLDVREERSIPAQELEFRVASDEMLEFRGYASVFDSPYDAFGGPDAGGWVETIDRRAFDKTLAEKPHVHLLVNHEGLPLASTKSGTLRLSTDQRGLKAEADLDRRDPDVQRLEVKMERRDMDEMSFAWRTKRQEWDDDYTERRILEASMHKGDVSIVNFGMNPAASGASLRSMLSFLEGIDHAEALAEVRSLDGHLAQLRAARSTIDRLLRDATPPEKRTLSLVEARELIAG